jgi:hypothetical protein
VLAATVVLASLAGPALAPARAQDQSKTPIQLLDEAKRNENADVDRRYKATVRRTESGEAAKVDPWRTIRPAEAGAKKPVEARNRKVRKH